MNRGAHTRIRDVCQGDGLGTVAGEMLLELRQTVECCFPLHPLVHVRRCVSVDIENDVVPELSELILLPASFGSYFDMRYRRQALLQCGKKRGKDNEFFVERSMLTHALPELLAGQRPRGF